MRTEQKEIKIYNFSELEDSVKDNVIDNFIASGHFDYILDEFTETLIGFTKYINGTLDYSLSLTPARGEFIRVTDYESAYLKELLTIDESCPFTGVCYDDTLIQEIKDKGLEGGLEAFNSYLHKEIEYLTSYEVFEENCEANQYEFLENGELY